MGVALDQVLDGPGGPTHLLKLQTVLDNLAGNQETRGNLNLLFLAVARQTNRFHPIPQRTRNHVQAVGCRDKKYP